ncbi:hypothetical protein [Halovivax gelatinilyticus]|nr:hypothetical protein [Halovivax gelatinilyticus]
MTEDDSPFPNCPACDYPVTDVTSTGPHTHLARPCGCPLTLADVQAMND